MRILIRGVVTSWSHITLEPRIAAWVSVTFLESLGQGRWLTTFEGSSEHFWFTEFVTPVWPKRIESFRSLKCLMMTACYQQGRWYQNMSKNRNSKRRKNRNYINTGPHLHLDYIRVDIKWTCPMQFTLSGCKDAKSRTTIPARQQPTACIPPFLT